MPILIAPLVGFALGVIFAWAATDELAREAGPLIGSRALSLVVLFAFLTFGPAVGYFATYETEWSLFYLVDARHVPSSALLVSVLLDIGAVLLGFTVGAGPARRRRFVPLLPLTMVPLAVGAVVAAVFAPRLSTYGTRADVVRGFAHTSVVGTAIGWAIFFFGACTIIGTAWTVRELRTERTRRAD